MTNALEIRGLTKAYDGFALRDIHLTLPAGCILGLIGENGAGKTTLIRTILGLAHRDAGEVYILGEAAPEQMASVRREIGVVLDNVGIPASFTARELEGVMRAAFPAWDSAKYHDVLRRFGIPEDREFSKMSEGTKKKLGIAAALSHDPKLLILDEPTGGLDPVARDLFLDMLTDYTRSEEHSVILSSHIVTDLEKICDYVCFLHEGRVQLFAETDRIAEDYALISVTADEAERIPGEKIIGKRENCFGTQLVIRREDVPAGADQKPLSVEDLFVYMAGRKEEGK